MDTSPPKVKMAAGVGRGGETFPLGAGCLGTQAAEALAKPSRQYRLLEGQPGDLARVQMSI